MVDIYISILNDGGNKMDTEILWRKLLESGHFEEHAYEKLVLKFILAKFVVGCKRERTAFI
jgi:hypothetical protein